MFFAADRNQSSPEIFVDHINALTQESDVFKSQNEKLLINIYDE